MATDILDRLRRVNDKFDTLKSDKARLEGRRDQLLKDLKSQFGVDNIQAAEKLLEKLKDKKDFAEGSLLDLIEQMEVVVGSCE